MSKIDTSPDTLREWAGVMLYEDHQKLADVLGAIAEEKEAQGWQPIETAPKDGTWILTWCNTYPRQVVQRWDDHYKEFSDRERWQYDATHWMPLHEGHTS